MDNEALLLCLDDIKSLGFLTVLMCDYCDEAGLNKMKIVFRVLKSCSSVLIVATQGSKHGQTLRIIPYFCPNVLVWNFMEKRSSA